MDTPPSTDQQPSLDSLRTVEFRQTLRGYHIDDVDNYLEQVAVEAEALQEQARLTAERLRQAADRIAALERQLEQQPPVPVAAEAAQAPASSAADAEALSRTLILAQKVLDQTKAEAEAEAAGLVAQAEASAKTLLADTENHARNRREESERQLREDVARLEQIRAQLAGDVENITHHLDEERTRLRGALTEMVAWVDEHVQPAAALRAQPIAPAPAPDPGQGPGPAGQAAGSAEAPSTVGEPTAAVSRDELFGNLHAQEGAPTGP